MRLSILLFIILFFQFSSFGQNIIDVRKLGATGNAEQNVRSILQKAIDSCYKMGGGTVYVSPGEYKTGNIVLKSNVTLHLESGAYIRASANPDDYKVLFPIHKKEHTNATVLIYAENAEKVAITGKGVIDGQARHRFAPMEEMDEFIRWETENAVKHGVTTERYYAIEPKANAVFFVNCTDVTLRDVSVIQSTDWSVHMQWCERVNIDGIYVYSSLDKGVNADGIDIDGCRHVTISDCIVETGDDAIVLKTTLTNNKSQELNDVVINNCIVTSTSTGLKIGTETYSDISNVIFSNCVVRNSNRGLSIVVRDGANVNKVLFTNITVECNRKHYNWWGNGDPFWFVVLKRNQNSKIGSISDVRLTNIIATGQGTSKFEGFEGSPLTNFALDNVKVILENESTNDKRATNTFLFDRIHGLKLINIESCYRDKTSEPLWDLPIVLKRINGLFIENLIAQPNPLKTLPLLKLESVVDGYLANIFPLNKVDQIVQLYGKENKDLVIYNIDPMGRSKAPIVVSAGASLKAVKIK